ncbi:MAG: hypothetical protein HOP30_11105 [Cyclobacteriaceae bacterium]|nr:hypothetical protein [Cyclobacteriaceae bacterium]
MTTYTVVNEGNPIVPVNLNVSFLVAVIVSFAEEIFSNKTDEELDAQCQLYVQNAEASYKSNAWFSTPDESASSVSYTRDDLGAHPEPGYRNYRLNISFNLNAVVTQPLSVQTDLTGEEKEAYLQEQADAFAVAFKAERNWVDL